MKMKKAKPKAKVFKIFTFLVVILIFTFSILHFAWDKRWDGKSRFTIVDVGEQVVVKSWDPATGLGVELALPDNLEVDTVAGRGRLLAASLTSAGSADWAAASVAHYLGIVVLGEVSSLSWVDKLWWWWGARRVQWQRPDIEARGWVDSRQTADGATVTRLAPGWDQVAGQLFSSLHIAQEELGLKIVNTTSMAGLAAAAARVVESSGIKVVEVATGLATNSQESTQCLIVSLPSVRKTVGVRMLAKSFGCNWREGEELTLYLGRSYWEFVNGPN